MVNSQGATQKYKKFEYLEVFLHAWLHFCTAAAIVLLSIFFLKFAFITSNLLKESQVFAFNFSKNCKICSFKAERCIETGC